MTIGAQDGNTHTTSADIEQILTTKAGVAPEAFVGHQHSPLEQLGIDSLAVLELRTVVANRFGVEIPDEALGMSVSQIVAHINANTGKGT